MLPERREGFILGALATSFCALAAWLGHLALQADRDPALAVLALLSLGSAIRLALVGWRA